MACTRADFTMAARVWVRGVHDQRQETADVGDCDPALPRVGFWVADGEESVGEHDQDDVAVLAPGDPFPKRINRINPTSGSRIPLQSSTSPRKNAVQRRSHPYSAPPGGTNLRQQAPSRSGWHRPVGRVPGADPRGHRTGAAHRNRPAPGKPGRPGRSGHHRPSGQAPRDRDQQLPAVRRTRDRQRAVHGWTMRADRSSRQPVKHSSCCSIHRLRSSRPISTIGTPQFKLQDLGDRSTDIRCCPQAESCSAAISYRARCAVVGSSPTRPDNRLGTRERT
ncbi:hypothetical protein ABIA39_007407 [Nocardia sp. GAS34]